MCKLTSNLHLRTSKLIRAAKPHSSNSLAERVGPGQQQLIVLYRQM